ncbi:erythromycin esterase family protein [Spirosoma harenae]
MSDSVEQYFGASTSPNFYLDLRTVPINQVEAAWLHQQKWMRNIGSTVPAKPEYQFTPNHLLSELHDVLIHLDKTASSHLPY